MAAKYLTPYCPTCGKPASAIVQEVVAIARVELDPDGNLEYAGDSDVIWDSQASVPADHTGWTGLDENTEYHLLRCAEDHEWPSAFEGMGL